MSVQKQNVYHNTKFFGDLWFDITHSKLYYGEMAHHSRSFKGNTLTVKAPIHVSEKSKGNHVSFDTEI